MNELKVGLLTLLAIGSLVVVTIRITANKSGLGNYIEYKTILNDASGIHKNAAIKVAGIPAGRITKIELNGSQALLTFEVLDQIKVTEFSILKVKSVGFLGDKYIDIYLGNQEAARLKEGSMIMAEGGSGFEELAKDASEILKDVKVIARDIKNALRDEQGKNAAKEIVANVQKASRSVKRVAESLERIMDRNEENVNTIVSDVKKVAAQLAFETDRYQEGSLMNDLEQVEPILDKVDAAVTDLKEIIADVKAGKGTVGKLLRDEETVDRVNETLAGVNRLMNRVNNYQTNITLFAGVNSNGGSRTQFDLDLLPSPDRFFRLGVVVSDFGPDVRRETVTTTKVDDGPSVVTEKEEVDETAFKFNLQIGRKFNHWAFRAGLFETTGGVGIDYFRPEYGWFNSLEVFDYQEDIGPNVRLSTEIRVWNVVYARLSGEDLASKDNNQSATISAGLRFNDEDLASLVGLMAN